MRRTLLISFCLLLLVALGVMFTRVVGMRVPEQRATLEKLITDRTGLAVRFDNVHFAWNLDGTSAVFERVELTDPVRGRVRVVAPELRVEFDTWDFLRHQQFSLGRVKLSSPDIEITGDAPGPATAASNSPVNGKPPHNRALADDEAAVVRRFTAWAELMPIGRIEVEGARVHLRRNGDRVARNTFTLSQAVVSRGAATFNAFGTMLLSQDVGQALFVSAKLDGLGAHEKVSGELRVIARRMHLDRVPVLAASGRGTLDARLRLRHGRIDSGEWQATARNLELHEKFFGDSQSARFDHVTVKGKLEREAEEFRFRFTDLQLTRGAHLERAPLVLVQLSVEPNTFSLKRTRLSAERLPFMAAEFLAGAGLPRLGDAAPIWPDGWDASAGELLDASYDSQGNRFDAALSRAEFTRVADRVRLSQFTAGLRLDAQDMSLQFDAANTAMLHLDDGTRARPLNFSGQLAVNSSQHGMSFKFADFQLRSESSSFAANGSWNDTDASPEPLELRVASLDRGLLQDAWVVLALDAALPSPLAEVAQGEVLEGAFSLQPSRSAAGQRVNWQKSHGSLTLTDLASEAENGPQLTEGKGSLQFSRGTTSLTLDGGQMDGLAITSVRIDWPRVGAPVLQAKLAGDLGAPLLRGTLELHGLEQLAGQVQVEADARGAENFRQPEAWRVTARLSEVSLPLGRDLPPVEKLKGTVRLANGQLRSLALAGNWLGGPVEIESQRNSIRSVNMQGNADAALLLRLLGQGDAASHISGQLAWSGSVQRASVQSGAPRPARPPADNDGWQIKLASDLAGVESRLPEPFNKGRARALPVNAELRIDARGISEFEVTSGPTLSIRGSVLHGVTAAQFKVHGVQGDLAQAHGPGAIPQIRIEQLELKRAPVVLAAVGALLPPRGELKVRIDDTRQADSSLGALEAQLIRGTHGLDFSLRSADAGPHRFSMRGECASDNARCRAQFTADTSQLALLLRDASLPEEWPTETLRASGELDWPREAEGDLTRLMAGRFELQTQGHNRAHQLTASATLADGQVMLADVQGTGPAPDQVFSGQGRVALLARQYDLTVDYEQVSLAASAIPTPARTRLARAWTLLRGSAARQGWAEAPDARRVQWHGTWD